MGSENMRKVAFRVPTTMEELVDCDLPENVRKQYGDRLIRSINAYIEQETLQRYIDNRPKKKQKVAVAEDCVKLESSKPILIDVPDDSEDEFDDGIDYSAIELPSSQTQQQRPSNDMNPPCAQRPRQKQQQPNPYAQAATAAKKKAPRAGSKLKSKPKKSSYF